MPNHGADCEKVLMARLADLLPSVREAVAESLLHMGQDKKWSSLGSFDEAELLRVHDLSVHVISTNSRSLYQGAYISGNVQDQLLVNLGGSNLRFRVFRQRFADQSLKSPMALLREADITLPPGKAVFAAANEIVFNPESRGEDQVFFSLRLHAKTPYTWMYDAHSMEPSYSICVDASVTQILFILKTLALLRTDLPEDLIDRLSRHDDFSVRWYVGDLLLRVNPRRAFKYLCCLAVDDSILAERAMDRLKLLANAAA
jgi:hypothetical protein